MKKKFKNHYYVLLRDMIKAFKQAFYFFFFFLLFDVEFIALLSMIVIILIGSIIYLIFKWNLTTFEITETRLIAKSGVFIRKKNTIPLTSIQTVDLKQTFWQRLFKVNVINIDTGTMQDGVGVKLLLKTNDAVLLQDLSLKMKHDIEKMEETIIYKMSKRDVIRLCMTKSSIFSMVLIFISFCFILGDDFFRLSDALLALHPIVFLLTILVITASLKGVSMISTYLSHLNYKIEKYDDMLKVSHGFFTRKTYSVYIDRITCVKIKQNYLQKLFNLCSVVVVAMGYGDNDGNDIEPTLIPLIKVDEFELLFDELFADFKVNEKSLKPSKKSRLSYYTKTLIMLGITIVATLFVPFTVCLIVFIIIVYRLLNGYLRYHQARLAFNQHILFVSSGGFYITKMFVKFDRVDSLTYSSNYFQRRYDLVKFKFIYESRGGINECRGLGFPRRKILELQDILSQY